MVKIDDIETLTSFQRSPGEFSKRLEESGAPVVLTVNGLPRYVIQNPKAYQELLERAARVEELEELLDVIRGVGQGLQDVRAGRMLPVKGLAREICEELGIDFDATDSAENDPEKEAA